MLSNQLKSLFQNQKESFTDILGQDKVKQGIKSALLSSHHIILAGAPGIGKTTLAKNIAKVLPEIEVIKDCSFNCDPEDIICPECKTRKPLNKGKIKGVQRFVRIQGSPDLTVEDLIGDIDPIKALKFGPLDAKSFTPGKVFKANRGILFFDEINRCPEKLQNALLQVLEEGKITIGSYDVDIPSNFILIATMNPEDSSTEKLSDVFLDRFDIVYMNYPENKETEKEILKLKGKSLTDFPENLLESMILFVRSLRENENIEKKPSVRASIQLYERAQANALLKNKASVSLEDIKEAIRSVLEHRIRLKPSTKFLQTPKDFLKEEFKQFLKDNKKSGGCP
ncbi:AAA family ATPase [Candidatus Woesearchaeota archaeon]|nr:AAA family ATPase [Candidatus Woesearchaeota archaeon]|tara:strand:+ start:2431 stop:3447 length:1017 start_codon:yes stop_codon:yes gene_type:complete